METENKIHDSFHTLIRTFEQIGIKESVNKRVPSTTVLNCVGTLVDTEQMELRVLPERMEALDSELDQWSNRKNCTMKQLQSLIGKLQFVSMVVRPGRLFISHMLRLLREHHGKKTIELDAEFHKDVKWWKKYLPMSQINGTGIMWMQQVTQPDDIASSDSCLVGMGAVAGKEYIKMNFPEQWKGSNIATLELLVVVIMVKVWIRKFTGKFVTFNVDNNGVVQVLNSGRVKDPALLQLMRELIFVAAGKLGFRAQHIGTKQNLLPDLLSR